MKLSVFNWSAKRLFNLINFHSSAMLFDNIQKGVLLKLKPFRYKVTDTFNIKRHLTHLSYLSNFVLLCAKGLSNTNNFILNKTIKKVLLRHTSIPLTIFIKNYLFLMFYSELIKKITKMDFKGLYAVLCISWPSLKF